MQITHHAEGGFVRHADVADLPGALELGQRFEGIQQRHGGRGVGPYSPACQSSWLAAAASEPDINRDNRSAAASGWRAAPRGYFCGPDVIGPNAAVVIARGPADFRGEHQLFAIAAFRQPVADVGFSQPRFPGAAGPGTFQRHRSG